MGHHDIDELGYLDSSFIFGCYFYILGINMYLSIFLSLCLHIGIATR